MEGFAKFRDVFGQLPFLQTYTVISLGFPLQGDISRTAGITRLLETAALKLTDTLPWLLGQIVTKSKTESSSGLREIIPYEPSAVRPSPVLVKDCTDLCPAYSELATANAPFSMLDGEVISPRSGLPAQYEEASPVFLIQANFIKGGLILTFAGQHNTMDMTGLGQVIRLFAKALRSEPFTETEISEGNRDRRTVVSLLPSDEELEDHNMVRMVPKQEQGLNEPTASQTETSQARWAYYRFSARKLGKLKSLASALPSIADTPSASPTQPVSTNDALTAFAWQRILAARVSAHPADPSYTSTSPPSLLSRALSSRPALNVSSGYIGHMVYCIFTSSASPTTTSLSTLATALRHDLQSVTPRQIRSFVTLIDRTPDKGTISYGARLDSAYRDVMFSSWSSLGLAETGFGELGKPEWTRRPRFAGMPGLVYAMPKTIDGDIDLAVCLAEEDMVALEKDEEMQKFVMWIG